MKRAGQLRNRITIQQPTETNNYGEPVVTWSTFAVCSAFVQYVPGKAGGHEYFASQQIIGEQFLWFTIRYIEGLTTKMRINFNGDNYDIFTIQNVLNKNVELMMTCKLVS